MGFLWTRVAGVYLLVYIFFLSVLLLRDPRFSHLQDFCRSRTCTSYCLSELGPHLCMVKAYVFNFHEILCFHPHRGTEMTSLASSLHGGPFLSTFQGGSFILSPAFMQGLSFNVLPLFKATSSAQNGYESPAGLCTLAILLPGAPTLFQGSGPFLSIFTVSITLKIVLFPALCL